MLEKQSMAYYLQIDIEKEGNKNGRIDCSVCKEQSNWK